MPGQGLAAQGDGSLEAIGRPSGAQGAGQGRDRIGPDLRIDTGMNGFVGDDLDLMILQCGEDQQAGAVSRDMQAVGEELL